MMHHPAKQGLLTALLLVLVVLTGTAMANPGDQLAAREAIAAWDIQQAEVIVKRLETEGLSDPSTLLLAGHLRLMKGDYDGAVEFLSQAVHAGAGREAAHYLALAESTAAQTKDYIHHKTADGRFIISHAPGVDAVLVPYAEAALAEAWTNLTRIFDYVPTEPLRIEIYPTVDVLGAVSPLTVAEIHTSGTIALCKYNRLMITSPRDLVYGYDWLDTLSHEMIHLLITKKSRNTVPIWLHEGLAKYYEVMWKKGATPKLERYAESLLAKALKGDALISFEAMSPSMAKLPSQEATGTAFAEVFTVIDFLKDRAGRDVASDLLTLMRDGKSDREAVAKVAGIPWSRFETVWKAYLKAQNYRQHDGSEAKRLLFKGRHNEADELAQLEIEKARDFVWLGDRMRLKKRWGAAAKTYRRAVPLVGDESPLIQGKLGYALLRQGRLDEAATELEKPIAKHPRHVVLSVYLGEVLVKLGRFEEAMTRLEQVMLINPFDRDAHGNLAIAYEKLGFPDKAERARSAHQLINQ